MKKEKEEIIPVMIYLEKSIKLKIDKLCRTKMMKRAELYRQLTLKVLENPQIIGIGKSQFDMPIKILEDLVISQEKRIQQNEELIKHFVEKLNPIPKKEIFKELVELKKKIETVKYTSFEEIQENNDGSVDLINAVINTLIDDNKIVVTKKGIIKWL